jgi:hypothetical protein
MVAPDGGPCLFAGARARPGLLAGTPVGVVDCGRPSEWEGRLRRGDATAAQEAAWLSHFPEFIHAPGSHGRDVEQRQAVDTEATDRPQALRSETATGITE